MLIALPFIHEYSIKVQISILSAFLLISYLNRRARLVLGTLAGLYLALKILVPLVGWVLHVCKGIAWLGFYIYFFQKAVGYAFTSIDYVLGDGLDSLIREMDKHIK